MLREDARVPIEHLWANDSIQEVCQLSLAEPSTDTLLCTTVQCVRDMIA
jgi:hypothetical protein